MPPLSDTDSIMGCGQNWARPHAPSRGYSAQTRFVRAVIC